jgi:hypothetical protein
MKVFLIFYLITFAAYSQDFCNLFRNELKDIPVDKTSYEQLSGVLSYRGKINPDCIYFYLEYLNTSEQEKTLLRNTTAKVLSEYKMMRNRWLINQEELISKLTLNKRVLASAKKFIKEKTEADNKLNFSDQVFKADTNKLNYIAYKYLIHDSALIYEPEKRYDSLRYSAEKMIMADLQGLHTSEVLSTETAELYAERIVKYWYLFDDLKGEESTDAYELLVNIYNNIHKIKELFEIALSPGYSFWNTTFKFSQDYYIPEFGHTFNYVYPLSSFQYAIGMSFLIKIRNVNSILSHLRLEGTYFWSNNDQPLKRLINNKAYEETDYAYTIKYLTFNSNLNINSFSTIRLDLSTPIFYIYDNLHLEISASANYNLIPYDITYECNYRIVQDIHYGGGWTFTEGTTNQKRQTGRIEIFYVIPSVKFIYRTPYNLDLKFTGSEQYANVSIGYTLGF